MGQGPTNDPLHGLKCPTCDYDLTGLREHCCPECGEGFDALQLRSPSPSRAVEFTAIGLLGYAAVTLLFQMLLLISGERTIGDFVSWIGWGFRDVVHVAQLMSVLGGIACCAASIVVVIVASLRQDHRAVQMASFAFVLMLFSIVIAFATIPMLA